jgi:Predicted hydrolase of the alpha/beta superfamily
MITGCGPTPTELQNVKTNDITKKTTITSVIVGDSYPIYIGLPKDYAASPGKSYDVVYLLDGDGYFSKTQQIIDQHVDDADMNPVILVGIGNIDERTRDYTPTSLKDYSGSGGGDKFCNFLKSELIPYIDANYRTNPSPENRCLAGHSLGGLCVYYALFKYIDTFGKFLASSPSLWWDNDITFQYEADYASGHTSMPAALYTCFCTGDYNICPEVEELVKRLKNRNYTGLTVFSHSFEGITHDYSWEPAFDKGLPQLFKK